MNKSECNHQRVMVIYVLSGRRTWDEVICRHCGQKQFTNFR